MKSIVAALALVFLCVVNVGTVRAQMPDWTAVQSAQREAMKAIAGTNGQWRGPAWILTPSGEKLTLTQTERIGPFLDGSVKVIEGRGFNAQGQLVFNAFAIVSYDPAKQTYSIRSYAMGRSGDFPFRPTATGYEWEVPAGPGAVIRYTATIKGNRFYEIGERIAAGQPPVRVFEMDLERVGDSDWPAAGAVGPK